MSSSKAVPAAQIDDVLAILSRPDDHELTEIVELVAALCDAEAAGITLRRGGDYHVLITHGIEPLVCSADDTFCVHTMTTEGAYAIEDARTDPRFAGIGWVDGRLGNARFYASAPIYSTDHVMVGRLCVIDSQPKQLTTLQLRALEAMALSVTSLIELRTLQRSRPRLSTPDVRAAAATLMTQLSAELSHDMRVPLTSIIASVEMLTEELADHEDPAVGALLDRATRAADRMVRMLDQNMHVGTGSHAQVPRDVDLGKVVRQLVLDSTPLLENLDASVEVGPLPVLHGDPDELYSVLQNLLTNAVKFSLDGLPPRVQVRARRVEDGWRVSVIDNGVGIPEDRRHDVFSLFTRVQSDVEGHGIGLATVARIIGSHDGRVGVEEAPGGGAEVWFELPTTG